jgi:hypothetical protein
MKCKKTLIYVFVILFAFAAPSISDDLEELYTFSYGDWTGGAYRMADGPFSHCHVATSYENGIVFAIALTDENEINLLIVKKSWELSPDRNYEVNLSIDGKDLGRFIAIAIDDARLQIELRNREDIFNQLRLGNKLVVEGDQEKLSFSLRGSNKALEKVKECVDEAPSFSASE